MMKLLVAAALLMSLMYGAVRSMAYTWPAVKGTLLTTGLMPVLLARSRRRVPAPLPVATTTV